MKKNYFVLSLILMLFGINVSFAGIRVGQNITDPKTLKAGDKILLRAGTANNPNANPEETPFVYKWVASLADSMVWANSSVEGNIDISNLIDPYTSFSLEASEAQVKGNTAYYLKNDFNGKYLAYVYEETTENEDGELEGSVIPNDKGGYDAQLRLVYTADKNAAAPFAIVLASEGCNWNSEYTGEEQPSAENVMIYTTLKEYTEKEIFIAINQAYGTPWAANYGDWGGWFNIYTPDITDNSIDDLALLYNKVAEVNYIGGEGPGTYDPALVEAYSAAKTEAEKAINTATPDEAACKAALEKLEEAYLALAVLKPVPVSAGYYKFRNWASTEADIKMMNASPGKVTWINWNKQGANPSCVWELIDRNNGTFLMRNIATNEYISGTGGASSSGSPSIVTSKDSTGNAMTFQSVGNGQYVIKHKNSNNLHAEWSGTTGAGKVNNLVSWASGANTASAWYFETLSEDSIAYYKAIGDQLILDQQLADLLVLAQEKYDIGNAFTFNVNDTLVKSPEQFLSNAAELSTDTVYTNPRGVWGTFADGSGYSALIDGNKATYFHSAWGGSIAEEHYLDVDLKEDVNGFVIAYSKRGNNANNMPKAYKIYTAKADADTSKIENWTLLRSMTNQPLDVDTVFTKGFEPSEACRYVRFLVTDSKNSGKLNGYVFFALGGFQVFKATKSETCFNALNAEIANALNDAIVAAGQVKAGETTQEDIDKLQAAYDAYSEALPDPTELKEIYSEAETTYKQAVTETTVAATGAAIYPDPGTYRDADKAAFKAELDKVKAYIDENDANGTYTKDGIEEQIAATEAAVEAFKKTIRWINAADDSQEGTWYYIAAANRYFDVTGTAQANKMRKGMLYVQGDGTLENSTIYWATKDSIEKQGLPLDNATWRFINLGDSAVAVQNKATRLYIGQYQTHPASLSASPVAFKLSEIGYGSFTFQGVFFNGEAVSNNYLHSQVAGQTLVYWNDKSLGSGSTWDIYTTDRSEQGTPADDITNDEIKNFSSAQAGKLYTMCYPVGIEYIYDSYDEQAFPFYGISAISETELTLAQKVTMEPGEPFFYLAGDDQSLLTPNPTAKDTVTTTIKITDFKVFAQNPLTVNGLVGNYYNGYEVPAGMGYLKETTKGEEGNYTERIQTIEATTKNQEMGWNSAYINAGLVENIETDAKTITIKINGSLDTAIKDAIINAQKGNVNVYSIDGVLVKKNVKATEATKGLAKGIYIIGDTKVVVK